MLLLSYRLLDYKISCQLRSVLLRGLFWAVTVKNCIMLILPHCIITAVKWLLCHAICDMIVVSCLLWHDYCIMLSMTWLLFCVIHDIIIVSCHPWHCVMPLMTWLLCYTIQDMIVVSYHLWHDYCVMSSLRLLCLATGDRWFLVTGWVQCQLWILSYDNCNMVCTWYVVVGQNHYVMLAGI